MGKPESVLFCRMHDNKAAWDRLEDLEKFKVFTPPIVDKIKEFADRHSGFSRIDAVYALCALLDPSSDRKYQKYANYYDNDVSKALMDILEADHELDSIVVNDLSSSGDISGLYLFASVWAFPIWFGVDTGENGRDIACMTLNRILQLEENGHDFSKDFDAWASLAYMCDFETWHDDKFGNKIIGPSILLESSSMKQRDFVSNVNDTSQVTVWGIEGSIYSLENKSISSGGEGDIYTVSGNGDVVVKIYHTGKNSKELEEKLILMKNNPPSKEVLNQVAWPIDVVYDSSKCFCGFVMPKLDITNELSEVYVYPPNKITERISYDYKIIIALNICTVINAVHEAGYVFGDFNPRNIGVNLKNGHVAFLDTDSYHIVLDEGLNKAYRCNVCLDGYVAPELLSKCEPYKKDAYALAPLPTFTKETDNFALAIHIFKLLMNGYTPFNGIKEADNASTSSPGLGNQAIKRDSYCFKPGNKPQAVAVPPLETLPDEIVDLFTRAFMYGRMDPKQRPSAIEWYKALDNYSNILVQCNKVATHHYRKGLHNCPWCEADNRYNNTIEQKENDIQFVVPTPASISGIPQARFGGATQNTSYQSGAPVYTNLPQNNSNTSNAQGIRQSNSIKKNKLIAGAIAAFVCICVAIGIASSKKSEDRQPYSESELQINDEVADNSTLDITESAEYSSEESIRDIEEIKEDPSIVDVWLTSLEPIRKSDSIVIKDNETGKSNTGEEYSHYMFSRVPYSDVIYKLDGKYDTLSGYWTICFSDRDIDYNNSFSVYADDELIYTSESITGGSLPSEFEIDIKHCDYLMLIFEEGTGAGELGNLNLSCKTPDTDPHVAQEVVLPVWLTDLDFFNNIDVSVNKDSVGKTNRGNQYSHYLFSQNKGYIEYFLNGKYDQMSGLWTICYGNRDTVSPESFEVYADDVLVYTSPSIIGENDPVDFMVNINYCQRLKIMFKEGDGCGELGNIRLYSTDKYREENSSIVENSSNGMWLTDLDYLTNEGVAVKNNEVGKTNTSEEYSHYLYSGSKGEIEYYLKGQYSSLSGVWCICFTDRGTTSVESFEIYADDNLVYSSPELTGTDLPVRVDVSINNCDILKIKFTQGNGSGEFGNIMLY